MTEKLKTLMHEQAESVDFAAPDLDAMTRAGDRRRRQRTLAVVGGVAAAAVLGGVAVTQLGGGDRATDPTVASEPPRAVTWGQGSVLHVGDDQVDLGHDVVAFVPTADGYVFVDPEGTVWSWLDGEATEVGTTSAKHPRLVADDEGTLAGWVNTAQSAVVLHDQATGETDPYPFPAVESVSALDGRTVYFRDGQENFALDVSTSSPVVVEGPTSGGFDILAAEDGRLAFDEYEGGVSLGSGLGDAVGLQQDGSMGAFSPDGTWFTLDADEPRVFDASTGEQVPFDLEYGFAAGYGWLDDSTVAMVAAKRPSQDAQAVLLACTVPTGACEQATDELGTFTELVRTGFTLPTGTRVDD